MADDNYNKKVPKDDSEWEYPWNFVEVKPCGYEKHINSTPDKESFREFHPSGPYTTITKDGHKVELISNKGYKNVSNGETHVCEAAFDHSVLGGRRFVNFGGDHTEVAMDHSVGVHGQMLRISKGGFYNHTEDTHDETSGGGKNVDHNDGHLFNNTKEEKVCATSSNRILLTDGEHMSYTGGNWDTYGDKKIRLASKEAMKLTANDTWDATSDKAMTMTTKDKFTANSQMDMSLKSQQEITIEAQTKITIKVGSSKIEITSSGIDITGSSINFKQG